MKDRVKEVFVGIDVAKASHAVALAESGRSAPFIPEAVVVPCRVSSCDGPISNWPSGIFNTVLLPIIPLGFAEAL
jgi:hypothetical protein